MKILLWFLIIKALFCFSEGKPCPEKYRPHKTRCDAYYKCVRVPTKSHVWMPAKCERGLIFEPNLKMCVLPGDDWECNLGETISKTKLDENNIYGVDILKIIPNAPTKPLSLEKKTNGETVKLMEFIELINDSDVKVDDEGNLPVSSDLQKIKIVEDQMESSGDGPIEIRANEPEILNIRENFDVLPKLGTPSKVDPKLTSQLQRLSQIIEGLQNTYSKKGSSHLNELRPDQLNAFLAHFNIKNEFDSFDPNNNDDMKIETNEIKQTNNTKINLTNINRIRNKNKKNNSTNSIKSSAAASKTKIANLSPETKIILKNSGHKRQDYNSNGGNGYSNSQIVVNRPEGSVVFSLANPQKQYQEHKYNDIKKHDPYDYNTVPKISEETLKTVLELSKQMISNQNVRQVVPNMGAAIYQPFIAHPMYYSPISSSSYHYGNPNTMNYQPATNYHQNEDHESMENSDKNYDKLSATAYNSNTKKNNPNKYPTSTVIYNKVMPVRITTNSDKGIIERPETSTTLDNRYDGYENIFNQISELPTNFYNKQESLSNDIKNKNRLHTLAISTTTTPFPTTTATTTEFPYKYPPSPPTNRVSFLSYYTPNPHLDDSNANNVFENADEDRYPVLSSQQYHTQQLPPHLNFQYQQSTNKRTTNQFGSHINKQTPNIATDNQGNYLYQSNIKIPSLSSQSMENSQLFQQQQQQKPQRQPILFNVGLDDSDININTNLNGEMEQMNEFENDPTSLTSSSSSSSNYHTGNSLSNSLNKQKYTQFVTNQLSHQNLDQQYSYLNGNHNLQSAVLTPAGSSLSSSATLTNALPHNNNFNGINSGGANALVNLGGNYISYDIYKNKILPSLGVNVGNYNGNNNAGIANNNQLLQPNIEIVTCTPGIRQPNSTDCTKYFVCARKDSKILSYSCPPYTAFNSQARICDAKTYTICNPEILFNRFSVQENQKLQLEALKALQDAKRIRDEAIKAQALANLIRYQTDQTLNQGQHKPNVDQNAFLNPTLLTNILNTYVPADNMDNMMMSSTITSSTSTTTTKKPFLSFLHKHKRRKYYCREGDKIPDQISDSSYFVCYKTKDGAMHGHKMVCSTGLVFCSKTKLCTTSKICNT